ncbi:hypothetical protein [Rhodovastum atsumiense]|uniref:Uncharacterized protein n=1 Tax=Rhodovastum atsumiense TaxID=504468 RepID=A0A5M6ITG1_9PROT|nr:hypothetical protein [Rhodovastum atsumiense]KAA5610838.1 hypothetical protein F1189_17305 [Rhodovastum atsumiense]
MESGREVIAQDEGAETAMMASFRTARRTLAGHEAMAMVRKGQVCGIGSRDMKAQAACIAGLFQITA